MESNSAIKLTGTFLDEISHDIPHQNWGAKEWKKDFQAMKSLGINTVIMIRCGYKKWITYDSDVLRKKENCFSPTIDYLNLFLTLSEEYGMDFYFGLYDSGNYWINHQYQKELDINRSIIDEVWAKYGSHKAFKGWYISHEINHHVPGVVDTYVKLGEHCKQLTGLPVLISPYIDGKKAVAASSNILEKKYATSIEQYEQEWDEVFDSIKHAVDIVAFQDGHVGFDEIQSYFEVNRKLSKKHGIRCWSNCESFDRDMPIKFLPIKWEKMLLKLKAAQQAEVEKAITFEFSHFMSPNSSYVQAHHLYNRYMEYFGQSEEVTTIMETIRRQNSEKV
ncbi:DUF4434 domain-containing protein [Fulvivirga sp. M361]|uniref:DUF4434 domain-containing protein n=1 Tax=Fulvivirga sp. M361 TaxID=2594266 RepID=UPI002102A78A|nr:DUF4434 domain-containing protein [Fulvivirga sp. M361]